MMKPRLKITATGEFYWFWARIYRDILNSPAQTDIWVGPYPTAERAYRDAAGGGLPQPRPAGQRLNLGNECVYRPEEAAKSSNSMADLYRQLVARYGEAFTR